MAQAKDTHKYKVNAHILKQLTIYITETEHFICFDRVV